MCYVHQQDSSVKEKILTGSQWLSIIKDALSHGMTTVLLTGGEALMHPDFWMIYDYLVKSGAIVRLKSNGILLNEKNVERLKKCPPSGIDISLYGCNKESYIAVTGKDSFEIITANIKRVIDAGFVVRLMITPSAYMMPWIDEIMEYAKSFGVQVIVNTILFEAEENTGREKTDFDLTLEEYNYINQKRREMFPQKVLSKEEQNKLYANSERRPDIFEKGLFCNGGRTSFAINWDGNMAPCLNFPKKIIGTDVLTVGFESAWKYINTEIKKYEVPQKCRSCKYNTKCHYCPVQHSKCSSEHKCDPNICAFWQEFFDSMENI